MMKKILTLFIILTLMLGLAGTSALAYTDDGLEVHFLDVGSGQATLIRTKETTILIDGGDQEHSSYVVSYLEEEGISKMTCLSPAHLTTIIWPVWSAF
ncbi:MAG TPA: hypothetical protein GXZ89_02140 [Fastidiosipila sp.]|nr:hypothetical protein [Fastidiosipila sp.]